MKSLTPLLLLLASAVLHCSAFARVKRCSCAPPSCTCVPTIGSSYMTCDCHQTQACGCSTTQQVQQCQPTCQEVCQRSCTTNCAVCHNECINTCSTISGGGVPQIPQIPQTPQIPQIPQIPQTCSTCRR